MEAFLSPNSEARHLPKNAQINGFRALLCALVVAYHYGGIFFVRFGELSQIPSLYSNLIVMVVGLFFLVSGFFLSFKGPWDFLKNKFFRIYLPFAFTVFLVFLICYYSGYPKYISYQEWGLNFLIYPLAMGQAHYAAGNLWFIVYLWVFFTLYFLINLLAYPFRKKINLVPILMGICGVFSFSYRYIIWNETTTSFAHAALDMLFLGHYHCYGFLYLGYAIRVLYDAFKGKARIPVQVGALLVALAFLSFLMVALYGDDHYHYASAILFYGLLALFILALFEKLPFLSWGGFQLLGDASIWIYMIHENIGYLIIFSFYSIDPSLYPAGVYLAVVYAYLFGLGLYGVDRLLRQKLSRPTVKVTF
jgi:peptidoglycan/LPS O-acetylase OafA/YrhL